MSNILSMYNKFLKAKSPKELRSYIAFQRGALTQITFGSKGCTKGACGSCIMCNYGVGEELSIQKAIEGYQKAISEIDLGRLLLLGTYGSFLDTREITPEVFEAILHEASKSSAEVIIIETGYDTVNESNLRQISTILQNKYIEIELGLESVNDIIQQLCINKIINLERYKSVIDLVHSFGMEVSSNILVGAPFLTPEEQLKDSVSTVNWALEQGSDNVTLFPMNIKPNTLLYHLYQKGRYSPISNWLFVEVLNELDDSCLEKIYLSWYEQNLKDEGIRIRNHIVYPQSCNFCNKALMEFYDNFTSTMAGKTRRRLIDEFINYNSKSCNCREEFIKSIQKQPESSLRERLEQEHKLLIQDFTQELNKEKQR